MVSNQHGKLYKKVKLFRLKMAKQRNVAVIGDFGSLSFKIAVEIEEKNENNSESDDFAEEEEVEPVQSREAINRLNEILKSNTGEAMPWRDLKATLLTNFKEKDLILYKFGQKQDLRDFIETIGDLTECALVDVAVAVEFNVKEKILMCSSEGRNIGKKN